MKTEFDVNAFEMGRAPNHEEVQRLIAQAHQMRAELFASAIRGLFRKLKNDLVAFKGLFSPAKTSRHPYFKIHVGREGLPF